MLSISECDDFINPQWGNRVTRCPELSRHVGFFVASPEGRNNFSKP